MLQQALTNPEREICGLLSGREDRFTGIYPVKNIASDPTERFLLDPEEQIAAMREMRRKHEVLLGIYHSHPKTEAIPSATDRKLAAYPQLYYVIVSLANNEAELRQYYYDGREFTLVET